MFKKIISIWLTGALLMPACSVPDDPNFTQVVRSIDEAPAEVIDYWRVYEQVHDIFKWFEEEFKQDGNDAGDKEIFLEVTCDGGEEPITFGWTVKDLIGCMHLYAGNPLGGTPHPGPHGPVKRSFSTCIRGLVSLSHDQYSALNGGDDDVDCTRQLARAFQHAPVKQWTDTYTNEDLARSLVESAVVPEWAKVIGILVVGGVIVTVSPIPRLVIALCTLRDGEGCPTSPLYPPGATPQQGDR